MKNIISKWKESQKIKKEKEYEKDKKQVIEAIKEMIIIAAREKKKQEFRKISLELSKTLNDSLERTSSGLKKINEQLLAFKSLKPNKTFGDKIREMNNEEMARELTLVALWDKEEVNRLKTLPGGIEKWIEEYLNERIEIGKRNEITTCKNCRSSIVVDKLTCMNRASDNYTENVGECMTCNLWEEESDVNKFNKFIGERFNKII